MTTEQMQKPKKTNGMVSLAVQPKDMTDDTVDVSLKTVSTDREVEGGLESD